MYRVPDRDWSFLVGRRIVEGSAGPASVHFSFDGELVLMMSGAVSIDGGEEEDVADVRERLLAFIGRTIKSAQRVDEWRLELRFTDGSRLVLVDDTDYYESFYFLLPEEDWIIV